MGALFDGNMAILGKYVDIYVYTYVCMCYFGGRDRVSGVG